MEDKSAVEYVSAAQAMEYLDVRAQTLYAYVSRGLLRSTPVPGSRQKRYLRSDLERLKARAQARSGHGPVAATAMHGGEPIVPTSITEITPDGPKYRGHAAVDLARAGTSFEAVADLLWRGVLNENHPGWRAQHPPRQLAELAPLAGSGLGDEFLEVLAATILQLGVLGGSISQRLHEGNTHAAGREIILTAAGCFGLLVPGGGFRPVVSGQSVADALASALRLGRQSAPRRILEAVLVVLADHELSPGTFAARVAASGGCTLHSCIASAICTSSGVKIGRLYGLVATMLERHASSRTLRAHVDGLRARGAAPPGFDHPLYPAGDPRARYLLELARTLPGKEHPGLREVLELVDHVEQTHGLYPRHELAVVALCRALRLPAHTPSALFVLARIAGWVAHVQEQRLSGMLMRPRAKFVST